MPEHVRVSSDGRNSIEKTKLHSRAPDAQKDERNTLVGRVPNHIGIGKENRASQADANVDFPNRVATLQSTRADHLLLRLQRKQGNYRVQQLLARTGTPTKEAEEEAPRTTRLVLRRELPPPITSVPVVAPIQRTIAAPSVASGVSSEHVAEFRTLVAQYQALLRSGVLSEEEVSEVNQAIARAETALRHAEQVATAGSSLRAGAGVALGASAVLAADDATGIGVVDDVALPFTLIAAGLLALGAVIAGSSSADIQRTGDAARDAVGQAIRAISQILLAQRVGDQVRGLSTQIVIHLARILGTAVSGQPPDHQGDPERDRPHWWTEVKNWIRQIREKGLSPRQLLRELRRRFSDQQLAEIRRAIGEAARRMGEDPPDFPPTVTP